jgi:hypothetical protein
MAFNFDEDPEAENQFGEEPAPEEEQPAEESSNNRTFMIAAGVLGGLVLLSLICMGAYVLFLAPSRNAGVEATQQAISANNTQVAVMFTQTAQALLIPPTTEPTNTLTPTNTPVIAQASSTPEPPTLTPDPLTATVAALYTQAAINALTVVPTSTALGTALAQPSQVPATGFADEVGLPGLAIMSVVLVAVILLARRLRAAPTR